jgi:hypothetical protein
MWILAERSQIHEGFQETANWCDRGKSATLAHRAVIAAGRQPSRNILCAENDRSTDGSRGMIDALAQGVATVGAWKTISAAVTAAMIYRTKQWRKIPRRFQPNRVVRHLIFLNAFYRPGWIVGTRSNVPSAFLHSRGPTGATLAEPRQRRPGPPCQRSAIVSLKP